MSEDRTRDQEYLQQQREILIRQSLQITVDDPFGRMNMLRPLSRTLSSPLVHLGSHHQQQQHNQQQQQQDTGQQQSPHQQQHNDTDNTPPVNLTITNRNRNINGSPHKITTGLAFDNLMLKHACQCGDNSCHPEHSGRLQSVWARLVETGLANRCDRLRSRKATQEELQTVHTENYAMVYGANQLNRLKMDNNNRGNFVLMACGGLGADLDTPWNEHHTAAAARMAAGCVIDLAFKVIDFFTI